MSKILRSYPRLPYVFSFILYLNTYFVARYLICAIGVNAGEKGSFGSILEQRVAVHKDGWNVATSSRRDVPICAIGVNAGEKGSFWKHSGQEGGNA